MVLSVVDSVVMSKKLSIPNDVFNRYIQSLNNVVKNYVTIEKDVVLCDSRLESFFRYFHDRVVAEGLENATKNTIKEMGFENVIQDCISEISDYYTLVELLKKCGLSSKGLFYKKISDFEDLNKYTIPCGKRVLYHKSFIPVLSNIVHYGKILSRTSRNYHNHTLKVVSFKELSKLTKMSINQLETLISNNKYYKSFVKLKTLGKKKSHSFDIKLVDIILRDKMLDMIFYQTTPVETKVADTNLQFIPEVADLENKKMVVKLKCEPTKQESNDSEINLLKYNFETLTIENQNLKTKLTKVEIENSDLKVTIDNLNNKEHKRDLDHENEYRTSRLEFKVENLQLANENSKLKVEHENCKQKTESMKLEIEKLTEKIQTLEAELNSIKDSPIKYSMTNLFKRVKK